MNTDEKLVHMVLADAWKDFEPSGYVPKYITLSLDKAKEIFKKMQEGLVKAGAELTLITPSYFEGVDGDWTYRYKLYSTSLDKLLMSSDYDE